MGNTVASAQKMSIVAGLPLEQDPDLGVQTIPGYLREVTARYAAHEALVMHGPDGVERWSYETLWNKSVEVARALIGSGVMPGTRVGVLMTNRPEFLSSLFGISFAGGVFVGLSTFSTASELEHLLIASEVSILLFDGRVSKKDFGALLAELEPQLRTSAPGTLRSAKFPQLRDLVRLDPASAGDAGACFEAAAIETWCDFLLRGHAVPGAIVEARAAAVAPSDLGGLFFSSGTTSLPKGILHSQRAFAIQWWRSPRLANVSGAIRSWTGNGFFWSGNITLTVGTAFSTGGAVVLQPYFEPETALRLIEAEKVTYLAGRPHQWARLQAAPNYASADLGSLRYITTGELLHTHPTVKTNWHIPMGYGATETMTINTSNAADASTAEKIGSFGLPLPGNLLKIVDIGTGAAVPRGQRGEVCIKGPTLMQGYIGKTAEEAFDPDGYFHTGDGGYVDDDGYLYWEGRLTEIIKTGGANVSPLEVDTALALYPGVRRCQTVGVPHDTLGEIVVSCVVPQANVSLDEAAIRAFLKESLASFKIPRRVLILREDEVLVTGNGKVKTVELRQLASERVGPATTV